MNSAKQNFLVSNFFLLSICMKLTPDPVVHFQNVYLLTLLDIIMIIGTGMAGLGFHLGRIEYQNVYENILRGAKTKAIEPMASMTF